MEKGGCAVAQNTSDGRTPSSLSGRLQRFFTGERKTQDTGSRPKQGQWQLTGVPTDYEHQLRIRPVTE